MSDALKKQVEQAVLPLLDQALELVRACHAGSEDPPTERQMRRTAVDAAEARLQRIIEQDDERRHP